MLGRPRSQESGASRGVRCPSGSLLQVGGQGQRILGFNLPPVISMTWQPELGSRVGWSPTGLTSGINGSKGKGGGVKIGDLEGMDREFFGRNSLEFVSANDIENPPIKGVS